MKFSLGAYSLIDGSDVLGLSLVKDVLRANRGTLGGKLFESDLFVSSA